MQNKIPISSDNQIVSIWFYRHFMVILVSFIICLFVFSFSCLYAGEGKDSPLILSCSLIPSSANGGELSEQKININFINNSDDIVNIFSGAFATRHKLFFSIIIRDFNDKVVSDRNPLVKITFEVTEMKSTAIMPNESHGWTFLLSSIFDYEVPGEYKTTVRYRNYYGDDSFRGELYSNEFIISIADTNDLTKDSTEEELVPAQSEELQPDDPD